MGFTNSVTRFDGFHISYNAVDRVCYEEHDTTAIVSSDHTIFIILQGDHYKTLCDIARQSGFAGVVKYSAQYRNVLTKGSVGIVNDLSQFI